MCACVRVRVSTWRPPAGRVCVWPAERRRRRDRRRDTARPPAHVTQRLAGGAQVRERRRRENGSAARKHRAPIRAADLVSATLAAPGGPGPSGASSARLDSTRRHDDDMSRRPVSGRLETAPAPFCYLLLVRGPIGTRSGWRLGAAIFPVARESRRLIYKFRAHNARPPARTSCVTRMASQLAAAAAKLVREHSRRAAGSAEDGRQWSPKVRARAASSGGAKSVCARVCVTSAADAGQLARMEPAGRVGAGGGACDRRHISVVKVAGPLHGWILWASIVHARTCTHTS
jgi:hypothetical protein